MPLWSVFAIQAALALAAFLIAPWVARRSSRVWRSVCFISLGVLLLWPLFRFFPVPAIRLLGAPVVASIELTGLFIPATLLLAVAARHVPKPRDRRAILLLIPFAAIYFVRAGKWMLVPPLPAVPELGPSRIVDGVCMQKTGYTCVAASMVTMLRAHGMSVSETEMARLAHVEIDGGATDSRALWALERLLDGTMLKPRYESMDYAGLIAAPKPCLVQVDFGFFVSHMVPVLAADAESVVLGDPLTGRRTIAASEFEREWKRNVIMLTP
jgi:hypothetical protein